jgi:Ca2+-dependent lipid-binding protein
MEADEESVEWMNSFMQKFWLIFEPVLGALVVENLDNYISDYLPPYLDSIRLSTFTLGTKPFRIESVKTFTNTDPDTVVSNKKKVCFPISCSSLLVYGLEGFFYSK